MKTQEEQLAFSDELTRLTGEMGKLLENPVESIDTVKKIQEITSQISILRANYVGEQ